MDFDAAFDQFMILLSRNPSQVYKSSYYRKQTKNQWARDDPAFAVIQILLLTVSSCAYGVVFGVGGLWHYVILVVQIVGIQYLGIGVIVASIGSWVANRQLVQHRAHAVAQQVEWLYAFDIHTNAFFPTFLLLHVLQFFLLPLLLCRTYLALVAANTLYAIALSYYFYITHLGYRALPFLHNTEVYLYPVALILMLFIVSVFLGVIGQSVNMSRLMAHLFFSVQ